MSDAGRKDLSSQVGDKLKPESQKSTTEKLGDTASGAYDRAAGAVQPESEKSTSQKLADSTRSNKDDASQQSKGVLQSAQDTLSGAAKSVSDTLSGKQ